MRGADSSWGCCAFWRVAQMVSANVHPRPMGEGWGEGADVLGLLHFLAGCFKWLSAKRAWVKGFGFKTVEQYIENISYQQEAAS